MVPLRFHDVPPAQRDVIRGLKNDLGNREVGKRVVHVQIQRAAGIRSRANTVPLPALPRAGCVQNDVIPDPATMFPLSKRLRSRIDPRIQREDVRRADFNIPAIAAMCARQS